MAIAITLRGFNDLRRSVTPIIYSMDHFLYRFSTFCEKIKKNLSSRSFNFLETVPSNWWPRETESFVFFSASLSVPWGEAEDNIEVEWKQIPLFHAGPVIKCFVIPPDSKLEKTCSTWHLRCLGPQYERQSKPSCLSEWHDGVFFFATNTMLKLLWLLLRLNSRTLSFVWFDEEQHNLL